MNFVNFFQNQVFEYVLYSVCSALMVILLAYTIVKLFIAGTPKDKLDYLKNYKKGQFLIIYLIAIPLYFSGYVQLVDFSQETSHCGTILLQCFFNAIKGSFNLVKLDYGIDGIVDYMKIDRFFYIVMLACFLLTTANVLMFSASLLWQRAKNGLLKMKAFRASEIYVVVGDNEDNILILKSLYGQKKTGVLFANPDAQMRDCLYTERIPFARFNCAQSLPGELGGKIEKLLGRALKSGRYVKKNIVVILNTGADEQNILFTQELESLLSKEYEKPFSCRIDKKFLDEKQIENESAAKEKETDGAKIQDEEKTGRYRSLRRVPVIAKSGFLSAYVYGELANKSAYSDLIERVKGHIYFLNRYELVSLDFIKKYPLTNFMTEEQIDKEHGLVNDDWEFNVCFIGYGPTTKQIFMRMVSDAQFYTKRDEKFAHKKVNYHFFDSEEAYSDKLFNQTYYRYSQEFLKKEYKDGEYLPLPEYPSCDGLYDEALGEVQSLKENKHFHKVDINDYSFLEKLNKVLATGKKSYNYVVISFGEDLENIDLAKKIRGALEISAFSGLTYLFAKVRNKALSDSLKEADEKYPITPFGCSADVVFNTLNNINDPIKQMAWFKSFGYPRGMEIKKENLEQRYEKAWKKWLSDDFITRESNCACCLNLRLKLNLLGFDYAPKKGPNDTGAIGEYYRAYFGTDNIDEVEKKRRWFDSKPYDRTIYTDAGVRTYLARQEHQRWNTYYISAGYVPLPKKEIFAKGGKDQKRMRHGCLTTFDALEDLRRETNGAGDDFYRNEKRKYDYKILDIADLILEDLEYKIIKK